LGRAIRALVNGLVRRVRQSRAPESSKFSLHRRQLLRGHAELTELGQMKCEDHAHPSAAPGRTPLNASGHSRAEYSNASIHGPTVAEAHLAELRVGPLVRLAPGGALGSLRSAAS